MSPSCVPAVPDVASPSPPTTVTGSPWEAVYLDAACGTTGESQVSADPFLSIPQGTLAAKVFHKGTHSLSLCTKRRQESLSEFTVKGI